MRGARTFAVAIAGLAASFALVGAANTGAMVTVPVGSYTPFLRVKAPNAAAATRDAPTLVAARLDFANALTIQGFTIPALSTRRIISEMDLRDGQSFAIAGLVDNRVTEQLEKIPGLGDVPLLGKLFQSRSLNKSRNELLVLVTPRVVQPMTGGQLPAGPTFPSQFLEPPKPYQTATPETK